jgi:flagellar biosynthesis/type III secretory pathway chaperone
MLNHEVSVAQSVEIYSGIISLYDALIAVLRKEISVCEELYTAIDHERGVLVRTSHRELFESNARKETSILKTRMLDEVRAGVVRKIARSLGREREDMNLSTLIHHAPEPFKEELRECQTVLRSLFRKIHEANTRNRDLMEASLHYIENSISFISNMMSPDSTYAVSGRMKPTRPSGRICSKKG